MKISVALCTFNGEKYLAEQLESVLKQNLAPYEIMVGDDGSTDSTLEILEHYKKKSSIPINITVNRSNLGFARNFLSTASRCTGEWVAFCDQDDQWLENKLSDIRDAAKSHQNAVLFLQNAWLTDSELSKKRGLIPNKLKAKEYQSMQQFGFWAWLGCMQTVRRDIFDLWDGSTLPRNYYKERHELSHDKWTCMMANAIGSIVVLPKPASYYRRHEAAITGNYNKSSLIKKIQKSRSIQADHYNFLASVADEYSNYLFNVSKKAKNNDWGISLKHASTEFKKFNQIQRNRSIIYSELGVREKLRALTHNIFAGGYFGPDFYALGVKSLMKDTSSFLEATIVKRSTISDKG